MCRHCKIGINPNAFNLSNLEYYYDSKPADALHPYHYLKKYSIDLKEYSDVSTDDFDAFCERNYATLNNTRFPLFIAYKCNKCDECLYERQNFWSKRAFLEGSVSNDVYFFDLTYDDEHLPYTMVDDGVPTLVPFHMSSFVKNVRNSFARTTEPYFKDLTLRFYYVGEYGSDTGRPHYHVVLFLNKHIPDNLLKLFRYLVLSSWTCKYYERVRVPNTTRSWYKKYIYTKYKVSPLFEDLVNGRKILYYKDSNGVEKPRKFFYNDSYKGFISKFERCRDISSVSRYIMKYINKDLYSSPIDGQYPSFFRSPRFNALGVSALDDSDIRIRILNGLDYTINCHGTIRTFTPAAWEMSVLCPSLSRYFPNYTDFIECIRYFMFLDNPCLPFDKDILSDLFYRVNYVKYSRRSVSLIRKLTNDIVADYCLDNEIYNLDFIKDVIFLNVYHFRCKYKYITDLIDFEDLKNRLFKFFDSNLQLYYNQFPNEYLFEIDIDARTFQRFIPKLSRSQKDYNLYCREHSLNDIYVENTSPIHIIDDSFVFF